MAMKCVVVLLGTHLLGAFTQVVNDRPAQLHISHGDKSGSAMTFMWTTEVVQQGKVQYRRLGQADYSTTQATQQTYATTNPTTPFKAANQAFAKDYTYKPPAFDWWVYNSPVIHTATVWSLQYNSVYQYRVGSDLGGYSDWKYFTTPQQPKKASRGVIAVLGDTGVHHENLQIFQDMLTDPTIKSALILGDFCYADAQKKNIVNPNGPNVWDIYFEGMEFFVSTIPTMTVVGNHDLESTTNRTEALIAYNARTRMPGTNPNKQYFSYKIGPVFVIVLDNYQNSPINGDDLKGVDTAIAPGSDQYIFLETELQSVNRENTPWVVVAMHNAMYHTNNKHRLGTEGNWEFLLAIEDLLFNYHVDLVLSGHTHNYERTFPMYKRELNPAGPTYIMVGTGGNTMAAHMDWNVTEPWSAFRLDMVPVGLYNGTWGYGKIDARNATHLQWSWRTWSGAATPIYDEAWLVRQQ